MTRERILLRVEKGALVPAHEPARMALRARGFKTGDLLLADLTKPRNPGFHRMAHALGRLVAENVDAFRGHEAHLALKRLQLESGAGVDVQDMTLPGLGVVRLQKPRSLAFDAMDEGEFHEIMRAICRTIADKYWQSCTPEEIERMAHAMVDE